MEGIFRTVEILRRGFHRKLTTLPPAVSKITVSLSDRNKSLTFDFNVESNLNCRKYLIEVCKMTILLQINLPLSKNFNVNLNKIIIN